MQGKRKLIRSNTSQTLEHLPKLFEQLSFFFGRVAGPQDTIEASSRSFFPGGKSGALRIRKEDNSDERSGDLHDIAMNLRDLLCDFRFGLIRQGALQCRRALFSSDV